VTSEAEQLWERVRASNAAWLRGEPRDVADLYADDAVLITPDLRRVEGRVAIVQSYVDYVSQVRTDHFRELGHSVELRGDVAVLTYTFDVRYEVEESVYQEQGQEVVVFARRGERLVAIWRTQITLRSRELAALVEP